MNRLLKVTPAFLLIFVIAVANSSGQNPTASSLVVRELDTPARAASGQPNLHASADGRVYLTWLEAIGEKRHALRFAVFNGRGWSESRTIVEGEDMLVNPADFPSLVVPPGGSMVAHWPVKGEPGTHASSIRIARSTDGGKTWSKPVIPHTDRSMTEHGFVSMLPWPGGRALAVWLDGRNMKEEHNGGHGSSTGGTNLRYTIIGTDGRASEDLLIDPRACECCQTSAALTSEGSLVVYRDRSEKEVRDISAVRFSKGKWSEPLVVSADGWEIHGCPVNGPSVSADGRRVAVAWFTAAKETPRVKVAFSGDAGASFGQPIQVDDSSPTGRVDVLMLSDGSALVSWLERTANGGEVRVRRIKPDGSRDQSVTLAESSALRVTGFPQMARTGNEVIFAWTQPGATSRVRTVVAKLGNQK